MSENNQISDENLNINEENNNAENGPMTGESAPLEEDLQIQPSSEYLLKEEKDRYIRLYAEFENYKKRTAKEKMEFFQFANQDMMITMLGILDDFERAIKNMAVSAAGDLQGIELIYQKFKSKLTEKGLKIIEVKAGDDFDVNLHEAITQIPAPSEDLKGKIVDVVETGYMLNDKVIRFAKVVTGN